MKFKSYRINLLITKFAWMKKCRIHYEDYFSLLLVKDVVNHHHPSKYRSLGIPNFLILCRDKSEKLKLGKDGRVDLGTLYGDDDNNPIVFYVIIT